MKSSVITVAIGFLLAFSAEAGNTLEMPTLPLRQKAMQAWAARNKPEAAAALQQAAATARAQHNAYVQANELRYIAALWAQQEEKTMARALFRDSMEAAIRIPTWNHRLYASIGVLEMQKQSGDKEGVRENGLKAIESGLLETVAATGEAAETGRFFTALNGSLTEADRAQIRQRILTIKNPAFQQKALHALDAAR